MYDLLRLCIAGALIGLMHGSIVQTSTAQSIAEDGVNDQTGNRHVQTSFTPVALIENSTPAVQEATVALSYVQGSWSILIRTEASDWSLARAEQVAFRIDDAFYETTDFHTVDAERTPDTTTEENMILAPGELRTLIADAEAIEATIGNYILDLSELPDHYTLLHNTVNASPDTSSQRADGAEDVW